MAQFDLNLLNELDLHSVAITAQVQRDGMLLPVDGCTEKLLAAKRDPTIHTVVMAKGQSIIGIDLVPDPQYPNHLSQEKGCDFWVLRIDTLAEAVEPLQAVEETRRPPKSILAARNALIKQVSDGWIKGVLEQSLYNEFLITLNLKGHPEAVDEYPWRMVLRTPEQPDSLLPDGSRLINIFNRYRALLILGEPGSGKTTVLLELARDLIARAQQNHALPIPVVFHLSSWTQEKQPIAEWLVDELSRIYRVHRRIARLLMDQGNLLLLLDGLDEVKSEYREDCVEAINRFSEEQFMSLVICCRVNDYEMLNNRLKLPAAVLLQPLTTQQINNYLQHADARLSVIGERLENDTPMQELLELPLMLNIMVLAYQGKSTKELPFSSSNERLYKQLFDTYIHNMLEAQDSKRQFTSVQTYRWLGWLAQRMSQHSQTVFSLEDMQPSWLLTRTQWWIYFLSTRLVIGLVVGLSLGLLLNIKQGERYALELMLAIGSVWGSIAGLSGGIFDAILLGRGTNLPPNRIVTILIRVVGYTLMTGLIGALILGGLLISSGLQITIGEIGGSGLNVTTYIDTETNWSTVEHILEIRVLISSLTSAFIGMSMGLIMALSTRRYPINEIRTVNSLSVSLRGIGNGCLLGATIGLIAAFIFLLFTGEAIGNIYEPKLGGLITASLIYWIYKRRKQKPRKTPRVTKMVLNSDGTQVATISEDYTVRLQDSTNGSKPVKLRHYDQVTDIAFHSNNTLISVGNSILYLRDTGNVRGKKVASFWGATKISLTTDRSRLATVSKKKVHLWKGISRKKLAILRHKAPVSDIAFDENSSRLATISGNEVNLWDSINGQKLATLNHKDRVSNMVFSDNGSRLITISGLNNNIYIWDSYSAMTIAILIQKSSVSHLKEQRRGRTFLGNYTLRQNRVWSVNFSDDGSRIATTDEERTVIYLWNGTDGSKVATLHHATEVRNVNFSGDGSRLATACDDNTVYLWNSVNGNMLTSLHHRSSVRDIAFSSTRSRLATLSDYDTIRLFDCGSGKEVDRWRGRAKVLAITFSADGSRLATTSSNNAIQLWDSKDGKQRATIDPHNMIQPAKTSQKFQTGRLIWAFMITSYLLMPSTNASDLIKIIVGGWMTILGAILGLILGNQRYDLAVSAKTYENP